MNESELDVSASQSIKKRLATNVAGGGRRIGVLNAYSRLRSCLVKQKIAIVQYHRIDEVTNFPFSIPPTTPQVFDREMRYLHRKYKVISLEELSNALSDLKTLPPNTAAVTIDDGYRDVYIHAYPILKKYGLPATVFLTSGHIGKADLFWWDKVKYIMWHTKLKKIEVDSSDVRQLNSAGERQRVASAITTKLKQMPNEKRKESIEKLVQQSGVDISPDLGKELILSWDEIREMSKNGINYGAHTINHPILTSLPLAEAKTEILGSKQQIEEELDQAVATFCYPNGGPGDYNDDIKEILESAGFKCAVITIPEGFVSSKRKKFELPRVTGSTNYDIFEVLMSGIYLDLVSPFRR